MSDSAGLAQRVAIPGSFVFDRGKTDLYLIIPIVADEKIVIDGIHVDMQASPAGVTAGSASAEAHESRPDPGDPGLRITRDRHATVAQVRAALAELRDSDVICTDLVPSGNVPVIRGDEQVAVIEMAPQDLGSPIEPYASVYWLADVSDEVPG